MWYTLGYIMVHVFVQILLVFVVTLVIFGSANYTFYENNVYEVNQIGEYLHNIQSTTNVVDKAGYLKEVSIMLTPYTGNPAWLFPMSYTNFEDIKTALISTYDITKVLSERSDVDTMSYQQSLTTIDNSVQVIHDRIHETAGKINSNPTLNPFTWFIYLILLFVVIPIIGIVDSKRNPW